MAGTPEVRPPGANVPGYLLPLSILATLFCCLPVGIIAIIFSAQAMSKSQAGNYAGASEAARRAKISLIIAVLSGIVFIVLIFSFGLLGSLIGGSQDFNAPNRGSEQPKATDNQPKATNNQPKATENQPKPPDNQPKDASKQ